MKRIVNIRPFFVGFIALLLGILLFTFLWLTDSLTAVVLGVFIGVFALALFATTIWAFATKGQGKVNQAVQAKRFVLLLATVFFAVGVLFMGLRTLYYHLAYPQTNGEYFVIGEIEDNTYEKYGYTFITLDNVVISNSSETVKLPSKVSVVVYSELSEGINASYLMEFHATLTKIPFSNAGYNFVNYNSKTAYSATILNNSYNFYSDKFSLDESMRNAYHETLLQNLPTETANLAYSLLFGQDEALSSEISDLFTSAGVVHILSVSGLHVAVLVAFILLLLHLFKVNRKFTIYIVGVTLLLYAYLCGFAPSVVRASIMSLVLLLALQTGRKFDALSALSLAGILILLVNPVQLFSLGFQLSFLSIFAIIALVPSLNRLFAKTILPVWLYAPIGVTLAITFLTFPVLANVFHQIAIYSVLSNLVVVPILSLAYVLVFVFATLIVAMPFLGFLLFVPQMLLHLGVLVLNGLVSLPFSVVSVFSDGYATLLCLITFAFVLHFVMVRPQIKTIVVSLLLAVAVGVSVYFNIPVTYHNNALTVTYQNDSNVNFVTTSSGEHILIGVGFQTPSGFENLKNQLRFGKIDTVIAYDYAYKYHNLLLQICQDYNVKNLYVTAPNDTLHSSINTDFLFTQIVFTTEGQTYELTNGSFEVISDLETVFGVQLNVNNQNILVLKNGLSNAQLRALSFMNLPSFGVVTANNVYANLQEYDITTNAVVTSTNNATQVSQFNLKQLSVVTIKL